MTTHRARIVDELLELRPRSEAEGRGVDLYCRRCMASVASYPVDGELLAHVLADADRHAPLHRARGFAGVRR
jgi:hypothetical protein